MCTVYTSYGKTGRGTWKYCVKAARRCEDIRARAARSVGKARADRFARLAGGSEGRGGAWGSDSGGRRSGAVRVGRVEEGRGVAERQRGATRRVCFRDSIGVLVFYFEFGWLTFEIL